MSSNLRVNSIVPATGTNVAIGTAGGTITYGASVTGVSTFSDGIIIGAGTSISSPSANTLKINAGIANSDAVTIGGGNFLYGTTSNAVYDTNGGVNVGDYWFAQFTSPSRGKFGVKTLVGAAGTECIVGFANTNTSGNSIISSLIQSTLVSDTAGSETGKFAIYTKPSTGRTLERFIIDPQGRVTKPYQPSFRAGRSSNYSPGVNIDIIFNTTANSFHHNIGGHYDTSNGRFTCPIAGRYHFTSCIIWGGGLATQNLIDAASLFVNGSNACYSFKRSPFVSGTTGGTDGYFTDHLNCILNLNAGDYVTIRNSYNNQVHGNELYCWFAGYLVG